MAILNAFDNKPVLSNISDVSEFRIKNSSLAFGILSSGLYANKIRAIIRELSCNAADAHIAANIPNKPFTIHLPTVLEPYFSLKDYGNGLSDDDVRNVFTVYFASTKSDSNNFIGALGLGCKSPLSYTNNFTVISNHEGVKNTYTVYINDQGVPAIALLDSCNSDEASGLEISFGIKHTNDAYKFREEAEYVYSYFEVAPIVTGVDNFKPKERIYYRKDIIPGAHQRSDTSSSYAIMGNIPYPINVPNSKSVLGELEELLSCGLEIQFDIGELDFQASREGLSYIPQTIEAIKNKLQEINDNLYSILEADANAISNSWERAEFLTEKAKNYLWKSSVFRYVKDNKFFLLEIGIYGANVKPSIVNLNKLLTDCNISLRRFIKHGDRRTSVYEVTVREEFVDALKTQTNKFMDVYHDTQSRFVIDNIKTGVLSRTKAHFKNLRPSVSFYVLSADDKTKPMLLDEFWDSINNPPESCIMNASDLAELPKRTRNNAYKNVSILYLEYNYGNYKWKDAGKLEDFDDTQPYYYVPLCGFKMDSQRYSDAKEFVSDIKCGIPGMPDMVYGVRRSDIDTIKQQSNWINAEEYLVNKVSGMTDNELKDLVVRSLERPNIIRHSVTVNPSSPFIKLKNQFEGVPKKCNFYEIQRVLNKLTRTDKFGKMYDKMEKEVESIVEMYPLLHHVPHYSNIDVKHISQYIEMIDTITGV